MQSATYLHFTCLPSASQKTVIMMLGPIGCGKSTMAHMSASKYKQLKIIEPGRQSVISAIDENDMIIISSGYDKFFSDGKIKTFILRNLIYRTHKFNIKIVILVPSNVVGEKIIQLDRNCSIKSIYQDVTNIIETVTRRINLGELQLDPKFKTAKNTQETAITNYANFLHAKSKNQFAELLLKEADLIFAYPMITEHNYSIQDRLDNSLLSDIIGMSK